MDIDEVDHALTRLRDAAASISNNLLDLELDPDRKLLEDARLEGETARRWADANASLLALWQRNSLLEALLERAGELRGTRSHVPAKQLEQLSALLDGPSIELPVEQVPIEERSLLGGEGSTERCRPEELLARMSVEFDRSKTVVAAAGKAWDTLGSSLRDARVTLDASAELAAGLGDRNGEVELDVARSRLAALNETLARDPLSLSTAEVESLASSLDACRRELEQLAGVRDELPGLLAEAEQLLNELRHVASEGEEAHQATLAKIASPSVPPPLRIETSLECRLTEVGKLAGSGAWRAAGTALEQWRTHAETLLARARQIAAENRAPIERRNELRGLLDAYRGKASRFGRIEDRELAQMYEEALDSLYTAPTDLGQAYELIRRYRQALAAVTPVREVLG